LPYALQAATLARMTASTSNRPAFPRGGLVTGEAGARARTYNSAPSAAGQAALGRNAAAPATLRAYKADWTHDAA
jgi:hypothetical protein